MHVIGTDGSAQGVRYTCYSIVSAWNMKVDGQRLTTVDACRVFSCLFFADYFNIF